MASQINTNLSTVQEEEFLGIITVEEGLQSVATTGLEETVTEDDIAVETTPEAGMEEQSRRSFYTRFVIGLVFLAFVTFVIVDSATSMHALSGLRDFLQWVEDNPTAGLAAFIVVYFVATVAFIPGALLTLGSGFVFAMAFGLGAGVVLGTMVVFVGASLGAIASFLLGRYLLRGQTEKLAKKYAIFEALEAALEKNGLKIFVLLRLSPIIPFNVINYLSGVTPVSLRDYTLALMAILPGTVLYVFLGASAGSLTDSATSGGSNGTVTLAVSIVGAVMGILAIVLTTRYAKWELNRVLRERESAEDETAADGHADQIKKDEDAREASNEETDLEESHTDVTMSRAEPMQSVDC